LVAELFLTGTRSQRIHRGKILIISELMKLPQTKHQLDDVILEVFLADGFPYQVCCRSWRIRLLHGRSCLSTCMGTSGMVCIECILAHFPECSSCPPLVAVAEQNRSYDRTFLLTPSTPAMRAYSEGWPAVIVNDSLTIRPYAAFCWQLLS
jgi:hypothetical protein